MAEPEVQNISNALHAACLEDEPGRLFYQPDLFKLDLVPGHNVDLLAKCINHLTGEKLFKPFDRDGVSCWKALTREEAAKYRNLGQDDALVYSHIESAGREGIWVKALRTKSNLHQAPLNKALKLLESKGLIKPVTSQKAPSRKTYMLSSLQAPEEVTGGPFYSEGHIDEVLIRHASFFLERYIHSKSWHRRERKSSREERHTGKRKHVTIADDEHHEARKSKRPQVHVPMPPGYVGYPTVGELTQVLNASGLSTVKLKEDEVHQLLDLLSWDGRVEKVLHDRAYKTVRPGAWDETGGGHAFTETPCGRCPVGDLCDDAGPVNAASCEYFPTWLGE